MLSAFARSASLSSALRLRASGQAVMFHLGRPGAPHAGPAMPSALHAHCCTITRHAAQIMAPLFLPCQARRNPMREAGLAPGPRRRAAPADPRPAPTHAPHAARKG